MIGMIVAFVAMMVIVGVIGGVRIAQEKPQEPQYWALVTLLISFVVFILLAKVGGVQR